MVNNEIDPKDNISVFEKKKIESLNNFFMRNVLVGLCFSIVIFILTIGALIFMITFTEIDATVKITIISMIATFILTTSKTLIDRTVEVVTYAVRLLGEEQRGFNKKMGIELEEIEFNEMIGESQRKKKEM